VILKKKFIYLITYDVYFNKQIFSFKIMTGIHPLSRANVGNTSKRKSANIAENTVFAQVNITYLKDPRI